MKLESLINHSLQLINIIIKSPQPADRITSEYLRHRKYIGSKERKFISGFTFSLARNIKTVILIYEKLIQRLAVKELNSILPTKAYDEIPPLNIAMLVVHLILINNTNVIDDGKDLYDIYSKLNNIDRNDFNNSAILVFLEYHNLQDLNYNNFINTLLEVFDEIKSDVDKIILKNILDEEELLFLSNYYSVNHWVLKDLAFNSDSIYNLSDACKIFDACRRAAPLNIRVDLNKISREEVINVFKNNSIDADLSSVSPYGILINERVRLQDYDLFKNGSIEVQDEGSQVISLAVDPESHDTVFDACAGAGGKSLHLAALMNDKGYILASDINFIKLKELNKRAARAGFYSITSSKINRMDEYNPPGKIKEFDAVLVDAPCSGMGTIRRMPLTKYNLTEKLLSKLSRRQLDILTVYSKFVTANGILLYSTCSLMPEENDIVVDIFLSKNPEFIPDPLPNTLNHLKDNDSDWKLHLDPYKHGTDGFFMARMRKTLHK